MDKTTREKWMKSFLCPNCGWEKDKPMFSDWMRCPKCGGEARCKPSLLLVNAYGDARKTKDIRSSDRGWKEDIANRRILPNGDIGIMDGNKVKQVISKKSSINKRK